MLWQQQQLQVCHNAYTHRLFNWTQLSECPPPPPLSELSKNINVKCSRWLSDSVGVCCNSERVARHLQTDPLILNTWIKGFNKQIPH